MQETLEPPVKPAELHGLSCPVLVPESPVWNADYSGVTTDQLVGLTEQQLAEVDPLVVNLIVAKGIPSLGNLDLSYYQDKVNQWAYDFATRYLPAWQSVYDQMPEYYEHNHSLFKVGMISQYLKDEIGLRYHLEQREGKGGIRYLNPGDLFIHGLIDTGEGTCCNMPALNVAVAWRMGWPVSGACIHAHNILRHDDGENVFNIETTVDDDGFSWSVDEQEIDSRGVLPIGLACGSELKALTPRERLANFVGFRARHFQDLFFQDHDRASLRIAERDILLARYLFPDLRLHCHYQMQLSALMASERFDRREIQHPDMWLFLREEIRAMEQRKHRYQRPMHTLRGGSVSDSPTVTHDKVFAALGFTISTE